MTKQLIEFGLVNNVVKSKHIVHDSTFMHDNGWTNLFAKVGRQQQQCASRAD